MNPPKLTLLMQSPLMRTVDTSKVKMVLSLGGIVTEQLRLLFRQTFAKTYFMIFYGLTEVSVTLTFPGQPIDGLTVGFVQPNHEIKIVDDDGNALDVGETGEIYAKFSISPFLVRSLTRLNFSLRTRRTFSSSSGLLQQPAGNKRRCRPRWLHQDRRHRLR